MQRPSERSQRELREPERSRLGQRTSVECVFNFTHVEPELSRYSGRDDQKIKTITTQRCIVSLGEAEPIKQGDCLERVGEKEVVTKNVHRLLKKIGWRRKKLKGRFLNP